MAANLQYQTSFDMTASSVVAGRQRNNFNLLRLCLAVLVIVSHVPEMVDGNRSRELLTRLLGTVSFGELAVDCFFLLSGYLILQSWLSTPNAVSFLKKRCLRIYPAFLVTFFLCATVVGRWGADSSYWEGLEWEVLLRQSATLSLPRVPPTFVGLHYAAVNGSLWSIQYEFMCYCAVLLLGMCGLLRRAAWWYGITALLVLFYLSHRSGLLHSLAGPAFSRLYLIGRVAMFFFVGGSFYHLRGRIKSSIPGIMGVLVALALAMTDKVLAEPAIALLGGYLLFLFANAKTKYLFWYEKMPDISYGVYLWAWPVTRILQWELPQLSTLQLGLMTVAISAALGTVSWYVIEKPALKFK